MKHYKRRTAAALTSVPSSCSPLWRNMLSQTAPFLSSVDFAIGDGKTTPFWNARWCGDVALRYRFPTLYEASPIKSISVESWILRFANHPNLGFQHINDLRAQQELVQLSSLSNTFMLLSSEPDALNWRWSTSGLFSARSAAEFLLYDGVIDCNLPFLWKLKIPLKVKLFIWLAEKNRILTAENLLKRGWIGPTICALCCSDAETSQHLLFQCSYSSSVWYALHCQIASARSWSQPLPPLPTGFAARWRGLRLFAAGLNLTEVDIAIAATFWELWNERNRRLFDNRLVPSVVLAKRIAETASCWMKGCCAIGRIV